MLGLRGPSGRRSKRAELAVEVSGQLVVGNVVTAVTIVGTAADAPASYREP